MNQNTASIKNLSVYRVGGGVSLASNHIPSFDADTKDFFCNYFLAPLKSEQMFSFFNETDLSNNKIYGLAEQIFEEMQITNEMSDQIVSYFSDLGKDFSQEDGHFFVVYFTSCLAENTETDAIGFFLCEKKESFFNVSYESERPEFSTEQGFSLKKPDKGCLIFNLHKEEGYLISVYDSLTKESDSSARFWMDGFLELKEYENAFSHTQNTLTFCKHFIVDHLPEEYNIARADQADLLNRSLSFFKERESFDLEDFAQSVIAEPQLVENFKNYKKNYETVFEQPVPESFSISEAAVKKESKKMKSVIKLDKNFHIYVHGSRHYIEKGFDDGSGLHFYKLSFKEES